MHELFYVSYKNHGNPKWYYISLNEVMQDIFTSFILKNST